MEVSPHMPVARGDQFLEHQRRRFDWEYVKQTNKKASVNLGMDLSVSKPCESGRGPGPADNHSQPRALINPPAKGQQSSSAFAPVHTQFSLPTGSGSSQLQPNPVYAQAQRMYAPSAPPIHASLTRIHKPQVLKHSPFAFMKSNRTGSPAMTQNQQVSKLPAQVIAHSTRPPVSNNKVVEQIMEANKKSFEQGMLPSCFKPFNNSSTTIQSRGGTPSSLIIDSRPTSQYGANGNGTRNSHSRGPVGPEYNLKLIPQNEAISSPPTLMQIQHRSNASHDMGNQQHTSINHHIAPLNLSRPSSVMEFTDSRLLNLSRCSSTAELSVNALRPSSVAGMSTGFEFRNRNDVSQQHATGRISHQAGATPLSQDLSKPPPGLVRENWLQDANGTSNSNASGSLMERPASRAKSAAISKIQRTQKFAQHSAPGTTRPSVLSPSGYQATHMNQKPNYQNQGQVRIGNGYHDRNLEDRSSTPRTRALVEVVERLTVSEKRHEFAVQNVTDITRIGLSEVRPRHANGVSQPHHFMTSDQSNGSMTKETNGNGRNVSCTPRYELSSKGDPYFNEAQQKPLSTIGQLPRLPCFKGLDYTCAEGGFSDTFITKLEDNYENHRNHVLMGNGNVMTPHKFLSLICQRVGINLHAEVFRYTTAKHDVQWRTELYAGMFCGVAHALSQGLSTQLAAAHLLERMRLHFKCRGAWKSTMYGLYPGCRYTKIREKLQELCDHFKMGPVDYKSHNLRGYGYRKRDDQMNNSPRWECSCTVVNRRCIVATDSVNYGLNLAAKKMYTALASPPVIEVVPLKDYATIGVDCPKLKEIHAAMMLYVPSEKKIKFKELTRTTDIDSCLHDPSNPCDYITKLMRSTDKNPEVDKYLGRTFKGLLLEALEWIQHNSRWNFHTMKLRNSSSRRQPHEDENRMDVDQDTNCNGDELGMATLLEDEEDVFHDATDLDDLSVNMICY